MQDMIANCSLFKFKVKPRNKWTFHTCHTLSVAIQRHPCHYKCAVLPWFVHSWLSDLTEGIQYSLVERRLRSYKMEMYTVVSKSQKNLRSCTCTNSVYLVLPPIFWAPGNEGSVCVRLCVWCLWCVWLYILLCMCARLCTFGCVTMSCQLYFLLVILV